MGRMRIAAVVGLLFLTTSRAMAPQAEKARVIIVLDASGSMWGQIEGKAKIEIAREALKDLLQDWNPKTELGLVVYGHRQKGDCNDIETLVSVGKANPQAVAQAVQRLQPKGMTPLSEAVRRAAQELKYTEERATVVLISDGVETCEVDPCEVGAELAMSGVDFTTHVIGFDVQEDDQVGLKCLAENTGGLFLAANDTTELREAIGRTVVQAQEAPKPVVDEPGEATLDAPREVPAGSPFQVSWSGPDSRGDIVAVIQPDARRGSYRHYAHTFKGSPAKLRAPDEPGDYEVQYVFGGRNKTVLARAPIKVLPVSATLKAPESVGAGGDFQVAWEGPDNPNDYVTIVEKGSPKGKYNTYRYTRQGNPTTLRAPEQPGDYEVRYIMSQSKTILAQAPIQVTSVSARLTAPESVAAGSNFDVEWEGPDNRNDYVTIVEKDAPKEQYKSYKYTRTGSPATLRAPDQPGDYEVRYVLSQSKEVLTSRVIRVTSVNASLKGPASIPAGADITVGWEGPNNRGDYVTIVSKGARDGEYLRYQYTTRGSPSTLEAPDEPGEYELRYVLGQSKNTLARTPIQVTPVTASITGPAEVEAGAKFQVAWKGPDNGRDYVTIVEAGADKGQHLNYAYTRRGSPATLTAPKDAGRYEIRYVMGQSKTILASQAIAVK